MKVNTALFWKKVAKEPGGCWLWTACTTEDGYGRLMVEDKVQRAHRVSYFLKHGVDPAGLHVLHTCDTPACVNPEHLYLGDNARNVQDRVSRDRGNRPVGELSPTAKLTREDVRSIRWLLALKCKPGLLAKRFKVDVSTIGRIGRNEIWKE